ncbi:MAG: hypothetical protein U0169_10180 [Polyangiaceae bacterium]
MDGAVRALAVLVFAATTIGCAGAAVRPVPVPPAMFLADARQHGIDVEDPLRLDALVLAELDRHVGHLGTPTERFERLVRFLAERGFTAAEKRGSTLRASSAFHQRRGDCLAYSMLLVATSRALDVDAYFVRAQEVTTFYGDGASLFATTHVAVGLGNGPDADVVDVARHARDQKLVRYDRIDDAAAFALFASNHAVDAMEEGDVVGAERTFRFLVHETPHVAEIWSNLVVALSRLGRHGEARDVAAFAAGTFPDFAPVHTNGLLAAIRAGDAKAAAWFEARGERIRGTDPLFVFARGQRRFHAGDYEGAIRDFETVLDSDVDSAVVATWLVRASVAAGKPELGAKVTSNRPR